MRSAYETEIHDEFRSVVRRFAERECAPGAAERDREARFPRDVLAKMADAELLGVGVHPKYGGGGDDPIAYAILVEELARVDVGSSMLPFLNRACMLPWEVANDEDKLATYAPEIVSGQLIGAYAVTEPGAGSDVGGIRMTAERSGTSWLLSGTKRFISNGGVADLYTVLVRTNPDRGHRGFSFFVVPASSPGLIVPRTEEKLGIRSSPTSELRFSEVEVKSSAIVGEVDHGFYYAMETFDRSRPTVGAQAVGVAQGALDLASTYLQSRQQFGEPLSRKQGLRWMLADMAIQINAARLMVYEAHRRLDAQGSNSDATMWSAMAKIHASDTAMRVTVDVVQLLGGSGYMSDLPAERFLRDAKITQIYEGTNQVLRNVVAKGLLG